ncbi:MAG: carboxylate-amine ligase [Acidobacteria bacterium]|nr:carboxylate-amine ligase [Acidobacteriota bacterium]
MDPLIEKVENAGAPGPSAGIRRPSLTLGIEEEFQLIDPETRELKSHIQELYTEGEKRLGEQFKVEMHQSVIEVGSNICANIQEARAEVVRLRGEIIRLTRDRGLRIASGGTHPITHWKNVGITPGARYEQIVRDLQTIARANLIFGLHVHVAVEDNETRIALMNNVSYFLPHIFALSVNSPFWCGENTGWKSYRAKVFERFPRTGLPEHFRSWSEYEGFVDLLVATGSIDNGKKIWWDVRAHPFFPTLEYRVCDAPMRVDEAICFAALFQALTLKLWKLHSRNMAWRDYRKPLLMENKNRAARWGIDGKLIDFGKRCEVPTEALLDEILEFIDDCVDELGSRKEVYYVREIRKMRTGADRQLRVFEETKDLRKVVDYMIEETERDVVG